MRLIDMQTRRERQPLDRLEIALRSIQVVGGACLFLTGCAAIVVASMIVQ